MTAKRTLLGLLRGAFRFGDVTRKPESNVPFGGAVEFRRARLEGLEERTLLSIGPTEVAPEFVGWSSVAPVATEVSPVAGPMATHVPPLVGPVATQGNSVTTEVLDWSNVSDVDALTALASPQLPEDVAGHEIASSPELAMPQSSPAGGLADMAFPFEFGGLPASSRKGGPGMGDRLRYVPAGKPS